MSEYDFLHIMKIAKQISLKMKKEIDCHCIALYAYEGIPHTHIHLIPSREEKDVCTRRVWEDRWEEADKCDLDSMADRLRME